jgi:hypothetical protein
VSVRNLGGGARVVRIDMIAYVRKVIREVIGDPRTPDECLDALKRLAHAELPGGLTSIDRDWLALWYEDLLTHASASKRFHDAFPDGRSPA